VPYSCILGEPYSSSMPGTIVPTDSAGSEGPTFVLEEATICGGDL